MKQKKLEELMRNSKDAYKYMGSIKKEYLVGNTVFDERGFVFKIKISHSYEDIIYLLNELKGHKETHGFLTKVFFSIVIPMYVALFAIIGIAIGSIMTFINDLSSKMIDLKIEKEDSNFDDAINLFIQGNSDIMRKIGFELIAVLIVLLFMLFIRHIGYSKRNQYLAWLISAKELKENEIKLRK
ncbi:hypothetical protein ACFSKI_19080 [Pseudogracilibacillus auburnensis]|uniref:Uncharacterized protein n=1 Tax=Pseudogracilibacillus auburnensis TaxID=1494959 RepID=A0A2V3W492_9BACI|nr:hypothetical protein [Pseudogracilibacillus auburnensis]PXW88800.1 hypothetical protein DFR56_103306 [Pseudogracilibacillus auburnensis]